MTSRLDACREARETLEWIKDWRAGQFTPAHTEDGRTVEMYGLVDSAEKLAIAVLASFTASAVTDPRVVSALEAHGVRMSAFDEEEFPPNYDADQRR